MPPEDFARRSSCGGEQRLRTSPTTPSPRRRSRAWRSYDSTPSGSASRRTSPWARRRSGRGARGPGQRHPSARAPAWTAHARPLPLRAVRRMPSRPTGRPARPSTRNSASPRAGRFSACRQPSSAGSRRSRSRSRSRRRSRRSRRRLRAAPAASEVRKTVTVLVARRQTVRGLDPEALSGEDERYSADLARTVERYGGTITSSVGGAVIAVFGVPRVHEDDPFRAVSAALEIRAPRLGMQSPRLGDPRRRRYRRGPGERFGRRHSVGRRRTHTAAGELAGGRRRRGDPARRGERAARSRTRRGRAASRPRRAPPGGFATSRANGRRSAR